MAIFNIISAFNFYLSEPVVPYVLRFTKNVQFRLQFHFKKCSLVVLEIKGVKQLFAYTIKLLQINPLIVICTNLLIIYLIIIIQVYL